MVGNFFTALATKNTGSYINHQMFTNDRFVAGISYVRGGETRAAGESPLVQALTARGR
jgi:hypothetical protein